MIWERPEPKGRTVAPINRRRIVEAAIQLADTEGLAVLSIRKVAAGLGVSPMRLYGYIATKEELLDLMVDSVYAEIASGLAGAQDPGAVDWADEVTAIALATRAAAFRHEWFIELLGGRPNLGPGSLAVMEATAAALGRCPGLDDLNRLRPALAAFHAYVFGSLRSDISQTRVGRDTGADETKWQTSVAPYLGRQFATGAFPTLQRMVTDGMDVDQTEAFVAELAILLRGIASNP